MDTEKLKQEARERLEEARHKLEEFEHKLENSSREFKERHKETFDDLERRRDELEKHYEHFVKASEDKYHEIKPTLESSLESFKEGFIKLGSIFSKKEQEGEEPK